MKTTVNFCELVDTGSTFSSSDFNCAVDFNRRLRLSNKRFYSTVLKKCDMFLHFMLYETSALWSWIYSWGISKKTQISLHFAVSVPPL